MSRNGSGTFNLTAGNPVVTGTTISSTWANNTLSDIANGLTQSISADGQTPITGPLIGSSGTVAFGGVGQTQIPSGTTAQRATSPTDGMIRYNTDLQQYEGYKNGAWSIFGNGAGGTLFSDTVTATQGQTLITMPTGYVLGGDNLSVYVNGSRQIYNVNYTETSTTSFTFTSGLNVGDLVNYTIGASTSLSVNAASVLYNEGGTGAVDTNVEAKLQETVSVKDFGAVGDGTTDDTAAIQNAINYVTSVKGKLYFPTGTYLHATTLIFKNNVIYYGDGQGSILKYTGTSDQIQVNNPINSSTAANITVQDLYLLSTIVTTGKANFADIGSSYLYFNNVYFSCNYYGLILDQSELVVVEKCNFAFNLSGCVGGIWIVNGPGHTSGALGGFTNRLTFIYNQFNGSNGYGIIDDGGTCHAIENNNFNGLGTHIRITAAGTSSIVNNEMEGATTTSILFANTYYFGGASSGASYNLLVQNNLFTSGGSYSLTFTSSCAINLQYSLNEFNLNTGGAAPDNNPSNYVNNVLAFGNYNIGTGTVPYNNIVVNGTWTPIVGGSTTLGTGTYTTRTGTYFQNGNLCTFQAIITWTAHTGTGGQIYVSLPKTVLDTNLNYVPCTVISNGITLSANQQIVGLVYQGGNVFGTQGFIQLNTSALGTLAALPMATSGTLYISGQYLAR